ncbi:MAG: DUF167 domain-containing protein [Candidatus Aenigmatarchaeota archaeon]
MKINVTVIPNSKYFLVEKISEDSYKVRVDAHPTRGEANSRLIEILSEYFGAPKSCIIILKGATSRRKMIEIDI